MVTYSFAVAPTSSYWLHRPIGRQEWNHFILPAGQKPQLASGEIVGPMCRRRAIKFMLKIEEKQRKGLPVVKNIPFITCNS